MTVNSLPAIDVHGHYGKYIRTGPGSLGDSLSSGDAAEVVRRARDVNIVLTIVSPLAALLPRLHGDVVAGNIEAARVVAQTPGLRQYVVIDPRRAETFAQAEEMLAQPQCVGIKIHPEEHGYAIRDHAQPIGHCKSRWTRIAARTWSRSVSSSSQPYDRCNRSLEMVRIWCAMTIELCGCPAFLLGSSTSVEYMRRPRRWVVIGRTVRIGRAWFMASCETINTGR